MKCIVCGHSWKSVDSQGPICDRCRDENPYAADRARMIEAAGDPTPEELAEVDEVCYLR